MKNLGSTAGKRVYNIFIFVLISYLLGQWFYNCASFLLNSYNNFLLYAPYDVAEINQTLWNTSKGRFFQVTASMTPPDAILAYKNFNFLVSHWNIIFLFISLFYLIFPHLSSLIIIQCLFISASAAALYLLAREILTDKKFLPLVILLIYIQYHPLTWISYFLHQESFCIVFLFFTLYFYLKNSLKSMLTFSIFSILCREESALIIALLGIISYFMPQKRKYSSLLILLGVLSFIVISIARFIISTNYREFQMYNHINTHYGYLGETFLDKLKNIVFHPSLILNLMLNPVKISLIKNTLGLLLYIPFLSPLFLIPGLPILAEIMLSQNPNIGTLRWGPWYLCLLIPFMFMALIVTFEKIYNFDKVMIKIFPKFFYNKKFYFRIIKAFSVILILYLSFSIYIKNTKLTKSDKSIFSAFFSIKKYWGEDTFEIISAVKEKAKVVCGYNLLSALSSRQYIFALQRLTKEMVDSGIFDIILISEDDWVTNLDKYELVKSSLNYKEIYSTSYITVFIKNGIPRDLLIDNWKFDLISKIKGSTVNHSYIFSNFVDFSTILENSGIIDTSTLMGEFTLRGAKALPRQGQSHQPLKASPALLGPDNEGFTDNKEIYYAQLEAKVDGDRISLLLEKPLKTGYGYIFAFVARAEKDFASLYVKGLREDKESSQIRMDNKARIYILPFKVNKFHESYNFLIQADNPIRFLTKPILLRFPFIESKNIIKEPVFQVNIGKYQFSYNPWIDKSSCDNIKDVKSPQILVKNKKIYANPVIYFMKLVNLPIPLDLYRYSWESDCDISPDTDIKAIRYQF